MHFEKSYNAMEAYGQSKLAMIMFSQELARRLSQSRVHVYSVDPGMVKTDLFREAPAMFQLPFLSTIYKAGSNAFQSLLFKTAQEGAQTTIYCAVDEKAGSESGLYYGDCKTKQPGSQALDPMANKKLWESSCQQVGLIQFKSLDNL
jgi:NAD(P)-dependent dehydrogenase (short-subunit alcohol dehydrogenase family)